MAIKAVTGALPVLVLGYPLHVACQVGLGLAQVGEFAFVLSRSGLKLGLIAPDEYQVFLSASVLSMIGTPLLLDNAKLRNILDTVTSKVVLILGRFTPERKPVLDGLRNALSGSEFGYVPVIFDGDQPVSRDAHETITLLARMARFVIADITDPKSIPQELVSIVEEIPSLPVQPILENGKEPWGMYDHIKRYPWVLPIEHYSTSEKLMTTLPARLIPIVETKVVELRKS